jgi:hypothetical protein
MIRSIRKRHRIVWIVLALILPVLIAAALLSRHAEPVNDGIPRRVLEKAK